MADFQISGELNLENVDQVVAELTRTLGKGTAKGFEAAQKFVAQMLRIGTSGRQQFFAKSFDRFERTLSSLEKRMVAMGRLARSINVDPNIFAAADANLEDVMRRLHQIDDLMEGTDDRATRRALQAGNLQRQLLTADMQGIRKLLSLKDTLNAAQAQQDKARLREQLQTQRIASSQAIVAQQTSSAQSVAATRAAAQRRVEIIRASIGQIRALERGLGAVFRGTANAIGASFSGLGRTISSAISRTSASTSRLDRQFTQGIGGALGRRESTMRSSFSRQERILSQSVSRQSATIQRLERVLSGGVLGAATGRGAAAGLGFGGIGAAIGGGAGLGALLTSGFQRFSELERLNKQFLALTGNQETAVALMEEVKAFAKVTPFDLVGVADLAKGFLAIGTNAADVVPQVKTIADAVALTGGGTDELTRIQRAIGQVVSAGRLQGDELNQLAENLPGLNIRKLLADQLTGGDQAELVRMQEAGEISADMFLNGILTGLSTDPRLAGAAEAMAGTLSGRFANLKEGFADLGASLIGVIAEPLAAGFAHLQTIFAGLAQFIRGEDLSATLNVLRTALAGAAAAITGLLVARAAGQAIQILAIAARALLSPFGIIVAAVGLVGAAIAVLLEHSALLGSTLGRLGDLIGKVFGAIGDAIGTIFGGVEEGVGGAADTLKTIGDAIAGFIGDLNSKLAPWLTKTAIPALQSFAILMRDTVLPAVKDGLGAAVSFIQETVIPGLQTAFSWIAENVFPLVQAGFGAAVDFIKGTIIPGFQAFISYMGGTVIPFVRDELVGAFRELQEFISGFDLGALARIGGVLAAALGGFAIAGPVGAAVAGSAAAIGLVFNDSLGATILGGLQNLGGLIGGALEGPFNAVKDFLADFFSADNLLDVFTGFLDIVEKVGEIIGNVLSDPRLLAGLAGFAAAAAATALKFVQGLIIGIASNLPELYAMLKEAGATALEFLVDALSDPGVLVKVIGALLVGGTLLSLWRSSGQKAGVAAGTGFVDGLKQRIGGGALFAGGGAGSIGGGIGSFMETLFLGPKGQVDRAARRAAETAQRAFRNNMRFITAGGLALPAGVTGAPARALAEQMAQSMATALGPSGTAAVKVRTVVKAFFTGNLKALADEAGGAFQLAKKVGTQLAAGIAGGIAGFQVGKTIAKSGGSLFEQLLGVGGTAAAVGAISGPAGIAAAAVGVLGIAMGNAARDAEQAAARVGELTQAFFDLSQTGTAASLQNLREMIGTQFVENLGEATDNIDFFIDHGLDLKGVIDDIVAGGGDLRSAFDDVTAGIGPAGEALVSKLGPGVKTFEQLKGAVTGFSPAAQAFRAELKANGITTGEFLEVIAGLDQILGETSDARSKAASYKVIADAIGDVERAAKGADGALAPMSDRIAAGLQIKLAVEGADRLQAQLENQAGRIKAVTTESDKAQKALDELFGKTYSTSLQGQIDDIIVGFENLPGLLADIDLTTLFGQAQFRAAGGRVVDDFKDAVTEGLKDKEILTVADINIKVKQPIIDALKERLEQDEFTPLEQEFFMNAVIALNNITDFTDLPTLLAALFGPGGVPELPALPPADAEMPIDPVPSLVPGKDVAEAIAAAVGAVTPSALPPVVVGMPVDPVPSLVPGKDVSEAIAAAVAAAAVDLPPLAVSQPITVIPGVTVPTGGGTGAGSLWQQIRDTVTGGLSGGGTGGPGHGIPRGGVGLATSLMNVDVPVSVAPDVTVAPLSATQKAEIRASLLGGEATTGTISFPVTINPDITVGPFTTDVAAIIRGRIFGATTLVGTSRTISFPVTIAPQITVAPTTTDVMGQIRARIFGATGLVGVSRSIVFPVTINPAITVAPTTTDVMGQIRARIFGATGLVGASRSIDFPVTINPIITIGNFAAIVAIGPQIVNSIILGIVFGLGALSSAMQNVARTIAAAAPAARAAGVAVATGAVQGLIAGSAPAAAAGVSLSQRFAAGIRSGIGAAISAARAVGAAASSNVGTSTSAAFSAGANLANAVAAGIRSATGNAVAAARAMANAVAAAARAALQITSPSKLFHKMGVNLGEGMAAGIDVGAIMAVRAAEDMARAIADAMTSSFQGASKFFLEAIDEVVKEAGERSQLAAGIPLKNMAARLFEQNTLASLGEIGGAAFTSGVASLQGLGVKFFSALQQTKLAIEGAHEKLAEQGWLLADEWALLNQNWMSVDVFSAAGARNVQAFMQFGEQIRGFVTEALNAGRSLEETLRFAKFFREDLISGALMGGVDMNTINVMLNQLGLSDAALADFVNQVRAATSAVDEHARAAEAAAKAEEGREASEAAAEEAAKQRARELELLRIAAAGSARPINVMLPYGDPQAAALAVSNRIAYDLSAGI